MDLEEVWRIREEEIYPGLFGGQQRGIFPLTPELFQIQFKRAEIDPTWLFYGVLEFGPTPVRPFWLYVTSGNSNPWIVAPEDYDAGGDSGQGIEFMLASTEQGDWAVRTLQSMLAFDILLGVGHFPGREPLGNGDRIPLRAPIDGDEASLVRNVILSLPETLPREFGLPSGGVALLTFTGVTDTEIAYGKAKGTNELVSRLQEAGCYPVTDPKRRSVI